MIEFEKITVRSMDEVPALLTDAHSRIIAGGTEVLTEASDVTRLVDISQLENLNFIRERGTRIEIGALVNLQQIVDSMLLHCYAPALVSACLAISETEIREKATIGGNLCSQRAAANCVSALMAAKARVTIKTDSDYRESDLERFLNNVEGGNRLSFDELITKISLPIPSGNWGAAFSKTIIADAELNAAVQLTLDERGMISAIRIALGGSSPAVCRIRSIEKAMKGKLFSPAFLHQCLPQMKNEIPLTKFEGAAELLEGLLAEGIRQAGEHYRDQLRED